MRFLLLLPLPGLIGAAALIVIGATTRDPSPVSFLSAVAVGVIGSFVLGFICLVQAARARSTKGACQACGYQLRAARAPGEVEVCPECGVMNNRPDGGGPRTEARVRWRAAASIHLLFAGGNLALGLCLMFWFMLSGIQH